VGVPDLVQADVFRAQCEHGERVAMRYSPSLCPVFRAQREHGEPAQLTSRAWKSSSWNWVWSPWKRRKTRPSCFEARKGLVHRQHAVGSNRLGRTPQRRERAVLEAEKTGLFVSGCPACVGKSPAPSKAGDEPAPATAKTGHKSDRIPLAVHSRDGRVRVIKS
jgi:hypothetical protein